MATSPQQTDLPWAGLGSGVPDPDIWSDTRTHIDAVPATSGANAAMSNMMDSGIAPHLSAWGECHFFLSSSSSFCCLSVTLSVQTQTYLHKMLCPMRILCLAAADAAAAMRACVQVLPSRRWLRDACLGALFAEFLGGCLFAWLQGPHTLPMPTTPSLHSTTAGVEMAVEHPKPSPAHRHEHHLTFSVVQQHYPPLPQYVAFLSYLSFSLNGTESKTAI